jgi:hypothetical protein
LVELEADEMLEVELEVDDDEVDTEPDAVVEGVVVVEVDVEEPDRIWLETVCDGDDVVITPD